MSARAPPAVPMSATRMVESALARYGALAVVIFGIALVAFWLRPRPGDAALSMKARTEIGADMCRAHGDCAQGGLCLVRGTSPQHYQEWVRATVRKCATLGATDSDCFDNALDVRYPEGAFATSVAPERTRVRRSLSTAFYIIQDEPTHLRVRLRNGHGSREAFRTAVDVLERNGAMVGGIRRDGTTDLYLYFQDPRIRVRRASTAFARTACERSFLVKVAGIDSRGVRFEFVENGIMRQAETRAELTSESDALIDRAVVIDKVGRGTIAPGGLIVLGARERDAAADELAEGDSIIVKFTH